MNFIYNGWFYCPCLNVWIKKCLNGRNKRACTAKVIHNGNDVVNYFKYGKSMNYISIRGCDTYIILV